MPGRQVRSFPYGEYRTTPTANLTDVGFTGHRQTGYIKLMDMEARWYSPSTGRFIFSYGRYVVSLHSGYPGQEELVLGLGQEVIERIGALPSD